VASDDVLSIGIDGVVAAPAADDVSTVAAEDAVVPGPGVDMVVAAAAKDDVAAGSTEERLVPGCPLDSPRPELSADLLRADPDDEGDGVVRGVGVGECFAAADAHAHAAVGAARECCLGPDVKGELAAGWECIWQAACDCGPPSCTCVWRY